MTTSSNKDKGEEKCKHDWYHPYGAKWSDYKFEGEKDAFGITFKRCSNCDKVDYEPIVRRNYYL